MWHAIGLLKKAGYATLGMEGGRDKRLAEIMKMHHNYDYICSSSEACRASIGEVFGYSKDAVIVKPLPRVDLLRDEAYRAAKRAEILRIYPALSEKQNILFAPTHRLDEAMLQEKLNELVDTIDFDRYNLIVKQHPLSNLHAKDPRVIMDQRFSGLEMAIAADHVIIDYSSILFEVAVLGKPIYFYTFDLEAYLQHIGFFIDFVHEIPGEKWLTASETLQSIEKGEYDASAMKRFLDRYVTLDEKSCTDALRAFIIFISGMDSDLSGTSAYHGER
jgi:CDP-ribitol ribitolphosphotransferase